jgi:hypothetical protein
VHYLNPWVRTDQYEEECSRFESLIKSSGGLDFAFFGTGADGHVARNEPGSSLKSVSRVHRLAYDTIVQLKERWGRDKVPDLALTMGMETIFKARQVLVLFAGVSRCVWNGRGIIDQSHKNSRTSHAPPHTQTAEATLSKGALRRPLTTCSPCQFSRSTQTAPSSLTNPQHTS